MGKKRVYELSKEYGMTNQQMMAFLLKNGITVNNHMSVVDMKKFDLIKQKMSVNINEHSNKTEIRSIYIEGLFKKYNYKFDFLNDVYIFVSENGAGKTTILNLINAVLDRNVDVLKRIDFKRVEVVFNDTTINIIRDDLKQSDAMIEQFLEDAKPILPQNEYIYLYRKYRSNQLDLLTLRKYVYNNLTSNEYFSMLDDIFFNYAHKINEISEKSYLNDLNMIKKLLSQNVLFYPTYRRIESSEDKILHNERRNINSYSPKYLKFGMEDVKIVIKNLLESISNETHNAYSEMNKKIIRDLIYGANIRKASQQDEKIDAIKANIILQRIGEENANIQNQLINYLNNSKKNPNSDFLKYYLDNLIQIYNELKAYDDKIKNFASICSKYLYNKKMTYNESKIELNICNDDGDIIDLDDLSSGEKQIISIFSKLYLELTSPVIFIIDEPEISLSINWQKEFLIDIYKSGKVSLLLAATHSPFIFKNELFDYTYEIEKFKEEKQK